MGFIIGVILAFILLSICFKVFRVTCKYAMKFVWNGLAGVVTLLFFNLFGAVLGIPLALNIFNATIAGFLGMPGIVLLLLMKYVI